MLASTERRKRTLEEKKEYHRQYAQKRRDELKSKLGTTYSTEQKNYIYNYYEKVRSLCGKAPRSTNSFRIRDYVAQKDILILRVEKSGVNSSF